MGSRVLSKYVLTEDDIRAGDALLLQFSKHVEALYGKSVCQTCTWLVIYRSVSLTMVQCTDFGSSPLKE